ncbi:hypothetical protein TRIP_C21550 [Candidatus Zixiibacteriota bacterium]|nr:hypothetical protein TRIP_C21550 [candidate division Zixibacteria bacterium]
MIKRTRLNISNSLIIIIIFLFGCFVAARASTAFIDLDGDGFSDNPPATIGSLSTSSSENADQGKYVSFELSGGAFATPSNACSARFESFKFGARALDRNRFSFDSDNFGPASAVGITGLSNAGGVCSGGSCHR